MFNVGDKITNDITGTRGVIVSGTGPYEVSYASGIGLRRNQPENTLTLYKPIPVHLPTKAPVYVAHAVPESISDFVSYLKNSEYTLHVVCRNEDQVDRVIAEYAEWSGGEALQEETILTSFDGSKWDREWFLIFKYSPDISYPFSVLERGTGGRKRQSSPVAWHRKGKIESCYAAVAEQLVRSGLRANY